jgi:hypothetical protein
MSSTDWAMGGVTTAGILASIASFGTAAPEAGAATASADASLAGGAAAADAGAAGAGTAAAVGAGAADVGTAAGLGSGLLAGTAGTSLGAGGVAASVLPTTVAAAGSLGGTAAGAFGGGLAGYAGATGLGAAGLAGGAGSAAGAAGSAAGLGGSYAGPGTAATSGNDFGMGGTITNSAGVQDGSFAPLSGGTAPPVSGPVGFGGGAMTGTQAGTPWLSRANTALKGINAAYGAANINNPGGTQTPMAPVARAPTAGRGVQNAMPVPAALPMMSNPGQSMEAMPDAGGMSLPTAGSSYQTLLSNMLGNEMRNPMTGLGTGTTGYMPGGGGMMNPSTIIPGMY